MFAVSNTAMFHFWLNVLIQLKIIKIVNNLVKKCFRTLHHKFASQQSNSKRLDYGLDN